jgi:hypothetical protein
MTWERKIFKRTFYGPKCEQEVRVIRKYLGLQNEDIVPEIRIRRLEWLGHVI